MTLGYLQSDQSIYIVYRGSFSARNWIVDLEAWKTEYTSFPECKCEVHKGFYAAEQIVIPVIVAELNRLLAIFPNFSVKVTGHSLGAALAHLTAMDLMKLGYISTVHYNFGMPRVGDKLFADFVTQRLKMFRVVHNKDMIPHFPFNSGNYLYDLLRHTAFD